MRAVRGPLSGLGGLYAGQAPHERVAILLTLLGGLRRVTLAQKDSRGDKILTCLFITTLNVVVSER